MVDPVLHIIQRCRVHNLMADRVSFDFEAKEVTVELYWYKDDGYVPFTIHFLGVRSLSAGEVDFSGNIVQELVSIDARKEGSLYVADLLFSIIPDEITWPLSIRFESVRVSK